MTKNMLDTNKYHANILLCILLFTLLQIPCTVSPGVFEKAEKLVVPINIHPEVPAPDILKPYWGYSGLAQAIWEFGANAGLHVVCSMGL